MEVEAVEGFRAGVDALGDLDVDALSDGELHRGLLALVDAAAVLEAATARLAEAWRARGVWAEDGSRSAAARLARDAYCRRSTANRIIGRATDLASMPATAEAFGIGAVHADHVDVLRHAAGGGRGALFARDEEQLVTFCRNLGFFEAEQAIRYWIVRADAELGSDGPEPLHRDRRASVRRGVAGEIDVRAILDPVGGAELVAAWEQIEHELYVADQEPGAAPRTATQRRADALVEMARRAMAVPPGREPRILVSVVVGDESFRRLCELSDGAIISPGQLVPYLDRVDVHTIVFDGPFEAIAASKQRTFTGALRRAVEVRDRHCQHPAGDRDPISRCDVDHIVAHADGGPTCQHNGRLLSRHRNRNLRARDLTAADVTVYDDDPLVIAARRRCQALTREHAPPP